MSAATVLDQFLDPLSRCLDVESARRVLALEVSAVVQERVDTLAERAQRGRFRGDPEIEGPPEAFRGRIAMERRREPGDDSATPGPNHKCRAR